jgi:iron(III) transport system ATP-binding protein
MRVGRVVQAASPDEVYRHPADPWIAGFLGDADFLVGHAAGGRVDTAVGAFPTSLSGPVALMIRPESVTLVPTSMATPSSATASSSAMISS